MKAKRKNSTRTSALGKGMAALIPIGDDSQELPGYDGEVIRWLQVEEIVPMKGQPRSRWSPRDLAELAASIKDKGVIQPLLVRPLDGVFELIAGERRWRASQDAGLKKIPAIVKDVDDSEAFQLALIENLQRENLNPVDIALSFKKLSSQYGLTQQQIAERMGKDRATVTNHLRMLKLPKLFLSKVEDGTLSFGHARALAALEPRLLAGIDTHALVSGRISVRELERIVAVLKKKGGMAQARNTDKRRGESPQIRFVRRKLEALLGLRVDLSDKEGKGKLCIHYDNLDQLDGLLSLLGFGDGKKQ